MDINQTNTLQKNRLGTKRRTPHLPSPTDVERASTLWSNEGDIILSPFTGIGSEGYVALKMNRRFVGFELKRSYYEQAKRNLKEAEKPDPQITILDVLEPEEKPENEVI